LHHRIERKITGMNIYLENIKKILEESALPDVEKQSILKAMADADKQWAITDFKLDRTEKVKKTTAILLEETIEELEQKRKSVEIQNHELEIESSLERVRTVAMGMNKTDDILSISEVLFFELRKLKFDNIRNAIIHVYKDEEGYFVDYDYSEFLKGSVNQIPYKGNPVIERFIKDIREKKDAFSEIIINGEELEGWKKFRENNNEPYDSRLEGLSALCYYIYSFGAGAIGISTVETISGDKQETLKRFRNVFDLAYKRYVDISNAEMQAREARIQLALERVRARTMAMHRSDELAETSSILFQQIKELGFETWSCGFCIWKDDAALEAWMGVDSGELLPPLMIPYKEERTHHEIYKAAASGETAYEHIWEGKELEEHYTFLRAIPSAKQAFDTLEAAGLKPPALQCYYVGFFKNGYLLLITTKPNPELKEISSRFANVFDLTYTRFLDLKKAEEQTRAAQIELAVERVRATALAMHSSTQILDVVAILRNEMLGLEIPGVVAATIYLDEGDGYIRMWDLSSVTEMEDGFHVALDVKFKLDETDPGLYIRRVWNNEATYFIEKQEAADMAITLEWLRQYYPDQADEVQQFFDTNPWKYLLHPTIQLADGKMSVDILDMPPPPEMESIMIKMGAAFDLAYKRFLDLKRSESQIREAQIELALERVRARTMAMQHSDELADTSYLLDSQVRSLGIPTRGCGFNIYGDNESTEWFSSEMGTMPTYKTPREKLFQEYYEAGKNGDEIYIKEFAGEACAAHYEYLRSLPGIGDGLNAMIEAGGSFPTRQVDHIIYFKYGYLLFITLEPAPEAHDIFIRFAKVFEQTYTRFLDLQKAEAQAVRAENDLVEIKEARKKAEQALTELQSAQKQLIQSEKMASLGELTAGIAHEIQNPLNFVNNFSEVSNELIDEMNEELDKGDLEEARAIAADIKSNLEKINHHGKRADGIVKGMLQHSRKGDGKKEPTDINVLCDEYVRLSFHGLRAKDKSFNAVLQTDFDGSIENINIIPQDIGRVVLNLLTNAFYAVDEKVKTLSAALAPTAVERETPGIYEPTVSIATKQQNSLVEIRVKDNGNGIPKNIIDKIFQPFFTTKPTGQGTGLGLSLAYDIITKGHGGELKVETEQRKGTTFTITLPTNNS
jgi:signal transduction histidine kinase